MSSSTTSSWSICCCSSFLPSPSPPPQSFLPLPPIPKHTKCCNLSISHPRASSRTVHHFPRSSTSSTPTIEEDDQQLQTSSLDSKPDFTSVSSTGGCKACGREEVERGCNGEGRVQGGIATFPGFGWWPIKAYRPCPGFVASGGRYRRTGQSFDEVAFGGGAREVSVETDAKGKSRKKKTTEQAPSS